MTSGLADPRPVADPVVDRAVAGDDAAFSVLVARHRGELYGHCRRMLSPDRAEDALQEALLRAWRARSHFAGRATFRTWLHRIAVNACLDELRHDRARPLRPVLVRPDPEDAPREPACADPGPDALWETGEAIEDAVRTLMDLLPPRQRAALVLCEVLRCSSGEAAGLLGTTVAAVNSARQRARTTLAGARPDAALAPRTAPLGAGDRALLDRYVGALRRNDVAAVVALAKADAARG